MKIWMSNETRYKNHYARNVIGGFLGSVGFVVVAELFVTRVTLTQGWSVPIITTLSGILLVITLLFVANYIGQKASQNSLLWFLTEERLFVIDMRTTVSYWGLISFLRSHFTVQKYLEQIKAEPKLPHSSNEILTVLNLKEASRKYYVNCLIRYENGHEARRTYMLGKDYENESQLLAELNKRLHPDPSLNKKSQHDFLFMGISLGLGLCFTLLCVLSHPDIAILNRSLYFPCLAVAFISYTVLYYFILKHKRGE